MRFLQTENIFCPTNKFTPETKKKVQRSNAATPKHFFTKKYDRFLAMFFVLFLIADYYLMRIPYFELTPLLLTLLLKPSEDAEINSSTIVENRLKSGS